MIRYLLDAQSLLENCPMLIVKGNLAQINRMLTLMLYLSPTSYWGVNGDGWRAADFLMSIDHIIQSKFFKKKKS